MGIIVFCVFFQSKMCIVLCYVLLIMLIGVILYFFFYISDDRGEIIYEKKIFKSKVELVIGFFKWVIIKIEGRLKFYGFLLKINIIYCGKVQSVVILFLFVVFYGEFINLFIVVYFVDEDVFFESIYSVKDLERVVWGIMRFGLREFIVSVEDVKMGKVVFWEVNKVRIVYVFFFKGVNVYGKGIFQVVVDWCLGIGDYFNVKCMVMFYLEEIVEVEGGLLIVEFDGEVVIFVF